jgi:hypothetical protein
MLVFSIFIGMGRGAEVVSPLGGRIEVIDIHK